MTRVRWRMATAAVLLAVSAAGAERSRLLLFTGPDGSRRVVNIPGPAFPTPVPQGSEMRRSLLWPEVEQAARAHGLDPKLVDLVIRMESGYNPRAISHKGARGVMQLMPETANDLGVSNAFDAKQNIRAGVAYLSNLMDRFGSNVALALAAYNAGPQAVEKHGGVPPYDETRTYVNSILSAYNGSGVPKLSGGFGRKPQRARPVELLSTAEGKFVSNVRRRGEPDLGSRLLLH